MRSASSDVTVQNVPPVAVVASVADISTMSRICTRNRAAVIVVNAEERRVLTFGPT
jgi:hypothetical protein